MGPAADTRHKHARRWIAAWNDRDLDAIMASYAENVDFVASTVIERWGRADGQLRGKAELRRHFARGLALAPHLSFTEELLLTGPAGYALTYRRENNNRALDVVELDEAGLAVCVRVFYENSQR